MTDQTQMSPAAVPEEWLQAAFDAIGRSGTSDGDEQIRHVLAAVLPLHERMVRNQIADAIYDADDACGGAVCDCCDMQRGVSVAIARGGDNA